MKSFIQVLCAGVLVVIAAIAGGEALQNPYGDSIPEPVMLKFVGDPEIAGPGEVEIGELARLSVEGEKVAWDCVPHIPDGQAFGENNQSYVASFRTPGLYTVIAAVYSNDEVNILSFPIDVRGPPEPVKPPVPEDNRFDEVLIQDVISWCQASAANRDRVMGIATVFGYVAIEIQEGKLVSAQDIINRTAILNKEVDTSGLGPLLSDIQTELTSRSDSGTLRTVDDHLVVWKSIAEGLERYARN